MTDQPTAPNPSTEQDPLGIHEDANGMIGHNNPPEPLAYDPDAMSMLKSTTAAFVEASNLWLKIDITTEELASQLTDQLDGLRKLYKRAEDERTAAKKPHLDRGKAVDEAFNDVKALIQKAANSLKPKLADYVAQKEARLEEERQKKIAEANRIAEEARLKQLEAENANTVESQVEAEKAQKQADKAVKAAAKPVSAAVKSSSGAGRTMSTRTRKVCTVDNIRHLFMHYQDHEQVHELLARLANAEANAAGFPKDGKIPGVTINEVKSIA
jgi:DNA repair exonuclease SbcCD ATPase subunit